MAKRTGEPGFRVLSSSRLAAVVALSVAVGTVGFAVAAPAGAATAFIAGDVVVYRVGDGSSGLTSTGTAVFLDEYSPSGTLVQSIPLPTTASGANKQLVASGSATSEGMLTLSPNSQYLAATGYDASLGTSGLSSSKAATTPRTVAVVNGSGAVDTSTALTDFSDGNNPRSAVTSDGTNIWVGGAAGGPRYATIGSTTSTALESTTYKNVRQVSIFDGQLYTSADPTKANITVAPIGTGLPQTLQATGLANLPGLPSSVLDPYGYSMLTLGSGNQPDTLYIADFNNASVDKYSLANGTWAETGSIGNLTGVTGVTANDNNGVVTIFATSSGSTGLGGTLSTITDSSGLGGTLTGSATTLATAPSNEAFRGIAFTPGTVIGSGGPPPPPPPVLPTITVAHSGLPAAINDPTNATDQITVGDANYTPDQLSVTATSSNQAVATDSGIVISGTGATRTVTVTPGGAVGDTTITLTVTAPDTKQATATITYGVSASLGDPSDRYFSGAGNASTAIDVGGGYMIVGDDESNILRLYNETQSGPPVQTYDFTSKLPHGTTEVDIEASARAGNTLYWTGSMSNNSSGDLAPARSTLFAATITGSGANTQLTYIGSYSGVQGDLVNWDVNNGSGLGANYFGFNQSVNGGIDSHEDNALNVEGMEFAAGSSTTAYLAFRAPLEPTTNRHLALVVPITNINQLVTGAATQATFGAPMQWDLGGLGIRDIKANSAGQYLLIAGTADDSNSSFVLYTWDGNPADQPRQTGTALPLIPAGANQGSWETVVSVPNPLSSGASVQLLEDNGDTAWYGDGATSKDTLLPDLQKDLGRVFSYVAPLAPVSVSVTSDTNPAVTGQPINLTATVASTSGSSTPTGTVDIAANGTDVPGCESLPLSNSGTASCSLANGLTPGAYSIVASYSGDSSFLAGDNSATPLSESVTPAATSLALTADDNPLVTGQELTLTATISVTAPGSANLGNPTGTVSFANGGTVIATCANVPVDPTGVADCSLPDGFTPGTESFTATYSGDTNFTGSSSGPLSVAVNQDATVVAVSANANPPVTGQPGVYTATVAPLGPGSGTPSGTVTFTVTGPKKVSCDNGNTVALSDGTAVCNIAAANLKVGASYTVTAVYSGDSSFLASNGSLTQTIARGLTNTTLSSSANPATSGATITLHVTVAAVAPASGTPTGHVAFTITGQNGEPVTCKGADAPALSGGSAQCVIAVGALPAANGPYTVLATYGGSTAFVTSSAGLNETVTAAPTTVTLKQSSASSVAGKRVTFTAIVAPVTPTRIPVSGTVAFTVTGASGDSVTCTGGAIVGKRASCTVAAGVLTSTDSPYTVTATYSGDIDDQSSSAALSHPVTPAKH